jgi:hypothetical protein
MLNDQFLKIGFYTFLLQIIVSATSNDTITVKVKFALEQATKAQRGSRDTALHFLQPRR